MTEEKTKERTLASFYAFLKDRKPRRVRISSKTHEAYYRNHAGPNALDIIQRVEIVEDDSIPFGEWVEEF